MLCMGAGCNFFYGYFQPFHNIHYLFYGYFQPLHNIHYLPPHASLAVPLPQQFGCGFIFGEPSEYTMISFLEGRFNHMFYSLTFLVMLPDALCVHLSIFQVPQRIDFSTAPAGINKGHEYCIRVLLFA